jgi:xanthine dehydrogenase accessory factor
LNVIIARPLRQGARGDKPEIQQEFWLSSNSPGLRSLKFGGIIAGIMEQDIYEAIVRARTAGLRAALATIIVRKGSTPRKDSAKMLVYESGQLLGTIGGGCNEAEVCREAAVVIRTEKPKLLAFDLTDEDAEESALLCGGTMEVYIEPILPQPILFVFGAGHVGQAVAEVAGRLGFKIVVADDRVKYANDDRFPGAEVVVEEWEKLFDRLSLTDSSYVLIATRGHQYDLLCLRLALRTPARYIGLLGSRRKTRLLMESLAREGVGEADFQRVYSPVGIAIGSETPEEIAVSIAAELIAVRKNLDVRRLRERLATSRP